MITVNIRGSREVERILREIAPKHAEALVKQTTSAIATDIIKDARREMNFTGPYSTGAMKKATKKRQRRTRGGIIQTDVVVGRRAYYWRFYEYGQGGNPRRGMFAKAIKKTQGRLAARWKELFMKKFIRRLERARNGPLRGRR